MPIYSNRASEISRGRGAAKFRYIREIPRNPAKLTKTREIPRNSLEILPNTCRYNIFETYLGYWSCLLAVNLQIYLEISSLPRVNFVPKLPGVLRLMLRKPGDWPQCKKLCHWCISGAFVVEIANDDLCKPRGQTNRVPFLASTKDTIKEKTFRWHYTECERKLLSVVMQAHV